jgi:hypothetical protein
VGGGEVLQDVAGWGMRPTGGQCLFDLFVRPRSEEKGKGTGGGQDLDKLKASNEMGQRDRAARCSLSFVAAHSREGVRQSGLACCGTSSTNIDSRYLTVLWDRYIRDLSPTQVVGLRSGIFCTFECCSRYY